MISGKVIDTCWDLLQSFSPNSEECVLRGFTTLDDVDELKQKSVNLLLSLIEGSTNIDAIKRLSYSLDDFQIVFKWLSNIYQNFLTQTLKITVKSPNLSYVNSSLKNDSFNNNV